MRLLTSVGKVSEQCEVCRASDKAPHVPIAATRAVSLFSGKLQVGLFSLDDLIALRAMDVFSKYFHLIPARSQNPHEV